MPEFMTMVLWLVAAIVGALAVLGIKVVYQRLNVPRPGEKHIRSTSKDVQLPPAVSTRIVDSDKPLVREVNIPVALDRLELRNIRSFSKLDLSFATPPEPSDSGQWTLILGDNGVGKSTILRSLVLALADPDIATALLQTQRSPAPLIRRGHTRGKIDVVINGSLSYSVRLSPGNVSERLQSFESAELRPALFAYGPLRGSAIGGSARQVSFSSVGTVATLFDESAQLIHAETWLVQRQLAALQSRGGPDEAFFDAVIETVRDLLPGVAAIRVTSEGVEMTGPEVGDRVPLAAMSDGYVGTLGWILDLIARWSHRHQLLTGEPPDGAIATDMRGLVVVDEIGLHLHPRWQTTVVRDVRKRFPNTSFIVTSHHPLMLLGAREGEIHVLRRHPETHDIIIEQANIPPGTTADQILTGRWFNLPSTLDEGTKRLLEEHRELLRAGEGEDHPRVAELEGILRGRLGTFADTSIDRMAQQVAAEVIKGKESTFEKLSPDDKETIREEMMKELRSRMERP